jgi:UDP-N-acetylmuramate--alanine ligase
MLARYRATRQNLCLKRVFALCYKGMHIYFSGIGGVGIGPLALIAKQAGYEVSGSDLQDGQYVKYLREQGISDINIGQGRNQISALNARKPIDWFVYSSALPKTNPDHPELLFCKENNIKMSKRDELLNKILEEKNLKLIAIAGTHGKTTTTAMVVWMFKKLGLPISYSLGAKISFGDMGQYDPASKYFIYECDEFDRNFLAFHPHLSIISGVAYDHHEIFPTEENYQTAFRDFIAQSANVVMWQEDYSKLNLPNDNKFTIEEYDNQQINQIELPGLYNRRDAWLAMTAMHKLTNDFMEKFMEYMSLFPGVARRFERITENLYSDDAHTPEKILGCMSVARELANRTKQKIVVVYEPLTNRRMHYLGSEHHSVFDGASAIYWVPSYLAREDPKLKVLSPEELITNLSPELQEIAKPMQRDGVLKVTVQNHLQAGDMVVAMAGGGADSLDEWLRKEFTNQ